MRLSDAQRALLVALQAGDRLQVHRTLDGAKLYRLHTHNDNISEAVAPDIVDSLVRAGLIESNMKFPTATFLLTDKGLAAVKAISGSEQTPIGPRKFN
jgi:predicted transcriptional regulator